MSVLEFALDFGSGCLGGIGGIIVGHPFDTVKVNIQTQNPQNPIYRGTWHCLRSIWAKESIRGLYKGVTSPIGGIAGINAIVFGVYRVTKKWMPDPNSLMTHCVAGTAAGLAQSLVCSPMELIKTRLQLQEKLGSTVRHSGLWNGLEHVWRHHGFRGVYQGLGITAARDMPGFASYFVSYELMVNDDSSKLRVMLAGGMAGVISWIPSYPIDVLKTRLQMDGFGAKRKYNGIVDCFQKSYRSEGIGFLFRGINSTLIRAFPMNAICFLIVDYVLKLENTQFYQQLKSNPEHGNKHKYDIFSMRYDDELDHMTRLKRNTMRGLCFLAATYDQIHEHEIHELTNDFYDRSGYYLDQPPVPGCDSSIILFNG